MMLGMEDLVCELNEDINEQGLPPGFRFHPTDEELITFYLASKVFNGTFYGGGGLDIAEVDLNRCEPWELPDGAKMGEREWYFFSLRDRKYPTGLRTNRATGAGYWKATGKDREVYSSGGVGGGGGGAILLGMKKTLVFYKGRAPRGEKTKWVMHEYRLDGHFSHRHSFKEEWVICRIIHKTGEKRNAVFQGQSYLFQAYSSSSPTTTGSLLPPLLESAAAAAATTTLLESQSHNPMHSHSLQQNPHFMQIHHHEDSDLKRFINPIVSQPHSFPIINGLLVQVQPTFSLPTPATITTTTSPTPALNNNKGTNTNNNNNNNHPSPSNSSTLLKSLLLSHQPCTFKEQEQDQEEEPTTIPIPIPKQCKAESNFSSLFQLPHANLRWVDKTSHHQHHHHHDPYATNNNNNNPLFLDMDYCGFSISSSATAAAAAPDNATITFPAEMSMAFNRGESWPLDL